MYLENTDMIHFIGLAKKIRVTKEIFHAKMNTIKDRTCKDLIEAEDIKKRWQEYTEKLFKKVVLKILQARLQHYMNRELPDVQAGFRKGRGTRDQIAKICWIMEKAREVQKNIFFCFIDYAFDCMNHNKLENSERDGNIRPPDLPLEKPVCRSGSNS